MSSDRESAGPSPAGEGTADPPALLALARDLALGAGDLLRSARPPRVEVEATKSSPTDAVTAMDLAVERMLRQGIAAARPDDGVLGEEDGHRPGTSGLTWVVDPLDGTVNYLYGLPAHAVSVAVVRADEGGGPLDPTTWTALAGCVHAPSTGETWTAARGGGAHLEVPGAPRRALDLSGPCADLGGALVGTGFGYRAAARAAQGRVLAALLPRVRDVRRIGSAALDLCAVADGRLDAVYEQGLRPWDLAAGALVVAEAGGAVTFLPPGPADASAGPGTAAGAVPDGGPTLVAGPAPLAERLAAALGLPHPPG